MTPILPLDNLRDQKAGGSVPTACQKLVPPAVRGFFVIPRPARRSVMRIIEKKPPPSAWTSRAYPARHDRSETLLQTVKLLKGLRVLGVPVYLTQAVHQGLGDTVAPIREAAQHRASGKAHLPALIPSCGGEAAAPEQQPPCAALRHRRATSVCSRPPWDLKAHGYQPYLVADCLSSRKPADHRMALERAKQEGILLTTCEATLFELLAAAGTPLTARPSRSSSSDRHRSTERNIRKRGTPSGVPRFLPIPPGYPQCRCPVAGRIRWCAGCRREARRVRRSAARRDPPCTGCAAAYSRGCTCCCTIVS